VIVFLRRYFGLGLVIALVAPLWLEASETGSAHDALIWAGVLLGCWLLIKTLPGFQIRGAWRKPNAMEVKTYVRCLLAVLLIDFGSKALFFRGDRPYKVEIFKDFGLHSVFHEASFEPFHAALLLYFAYLFFLGALFFRFFSPILDRVWLVSSTFALGGAAALTGEKFLFGGVHNSFYFAGALMWLCPPCASTRFVSYAWTPADFFVHAAFAPVVILVLSYFVPAAKPSTPLQSQTP
jgi:hypothetical protein